MNKAGSGALFVILLTVVYFMAGMIVYQLIKPDITLTRTEINCNSPDTSGDMFNCLIIGGIVPIFIITILSVAGGVITGNSLK